MRLRILAEQLRAYYRSVERLLSSTTAPMTLHQTLFGVVVEFIITGKMIYQWMKGAIAHFFSEKR
jgi:hypothetical protein